MKSLHVAKLILFIFVWQVVLACNDVPLPQGPRDFSVQDLSIGTPPPDGSSVFDFHDGLISDAKVATDDIPAVILDSQLPFDNKLVVDQQTVKDIPSFQEDIKPDIIPSSTITLLSPIGGEVWSAGTAHLIKWSWTGSITTVNIEIWQKSKKVSTIAQGISNSGSFDWSISPTHPYGGDYRIRVVNAVETDVAGISPNYFSINNWRYYIPIVVTPLTGSDLNGYQIRVFLEAQSFPYNHVRLDGADLRFSTSPTLDHAFDLPYWIETWNTAGQSKIWVRLPVIKSGQPQTIYLFYGFSAATTNSNLTDCFPNRFVSSGDLTLGGTTLGYDWFELKVGHTLTLYSTQILEINARRIIIAGNVNGEGKGFPGGVGVKVGGGPGGGGGDSANGAGGGGYGGPGGNGGGDDSTPALGGISYGTTNGVDINMGSGGGGTDDGNGGPGGGGLSLLGTEVTISGTIDLDGVPGVPATHSSGGGAGGGILLQAGNVTVSGSCFLRGGSGGGGVSGADGAGGGGGGRYKVFYEENYKFSGNVLLTPGAGGLGGNVSDGQPGEFGTSHTVKREILPVTVTVGTEVPL